MISNIETTIIAIISIKAVVAIRSPVARLTFHDLIFSIARDTLLAFIRKALSYLYSNSALNLVLREIRINIIIALYT